MVSGLRFLPPPSHLPNHNNLSNNQTIDRSGARFSRHRPHDSHEHDHPLPARRHRRPTPAPLRPHAADEPLLRQPHLSMGKAPHAPSGRLAAWGGLWHSQKEAVPLSAQPLPQVLEFQSRPFPPPLTMQAQTSSRISSAKRSDRRTASRRRGSGGCSSPTKGSRTTARPPCGPIPRVTAPMAPAGPSTSTLPATSPRRLGGTRLQAMCTSSLVWGRPARGQRGPETADWPRLARRNSRQPRARSDARQEQPPGS